MSPEDPHKPIRIYIGGLILGVNTLYMFFCFFKLFAVVGNELICDTAHDICTAPCRPLHEDGSGSETVSFPYPLGLGTRLVPGLHGHMTTW